MKPYLYTIVSEEKLKAMLETFGNCIHIPIQALDEKGKVLQSYG